MAEIEFRCESCGAVDETSKMLNFQRTGRTTISLPDPPPFRAPILCPQCSGAMSELIRTMLGVVPPDELRCTNVDPGGRRCERGLGHLGVCITKEPAPPAQMAGGGTTPAPGGGDAH